MSTDWFSDVMDEYHTTLKLREEAEIARKYDEGKVTSKLLREVLDVDVECTEKDCVLINDDDKYTFTTITKIEGTWPATYRLGLKGKCIRCGTEVSREITSKSDCGEAIDKWLKTALCGSCITKELGASF